METSDPTTSQTVSGVQVTPVFEKAKITDLQTVTLENGRTQQNITAEVHDGVDSGKTVQMQFLPTVEGSDAYHTGETIVITKTAIDGQDYYFAVDHYRIPSLLYITLSFIILIIVLARKRGAFSLLGMLISVSILALYIVPRIVHNGNPLVVSVIGSVLIGIISLYVAHGLNRRTTIALISTLLTIGLAIILSTIFVHVTQLTGLGSEDASFCAVRNFKQH